MRSPAYATKVVWPADEITCAAIASLLSQLLQFTIVARVDDPPTLLYPRTRTSDASGS